MPVHGRSASLQRTPFATADVALSDEAVQILEDRAKGAMREYRGTYDDFINSLANSQLDTLRASSIADGGERWEAY